MRLKHTIGRWMVSGGDQIVAMPSQCKISNRISGCTIEETEANAKLIASAPDLLECCLTAKAMFEAQCINEQSRIGGEQYAYLLKIIRKATE